MFLTSSYKHGWIQYSCFHGVETFQARACYETIGNYKTERAAKLAITKHGKAIKAQRAKDQATHHALIQKMLLA